MDVSQERELMDIAQALDEFGYHLGYLRRGSTLFSDADALPVLGTLPVDLDNLAAASRTFAVKARQMIRELHQLPAWNEAYREAYGMDHPEHRG